MIARKPVVAMSIVAMLCTPSGVAAAGAAPAKVAALPAGNAAAGVALFAQC